MMGQEKTKKESKQQGLAGVVAGDSGICLCGALEESLLYRGYSIEDLSSYSSFEEVSYLLLKGNLPKKEELESYIELLKNLSTLPEELKQVLRLIPSNSHPMDVLRTGVSFLGNLEGEKQSFKERLIALLPLMLIYWYLFQRDQKEPNLHSDQKQISARFLDLLHSSDYTEEERRAIDITLILYAEHEFNASTFTTRTIASTLSDYHSAIAGGIGALRGPLHGGANEWAMELLERFSTKEEAVEKVSKMLVQKELVMGFGHRVYTTKDPRSPIVKKLAHQLAKTDEQKRLFSIAEAIENLMWDEKKLFPNLDFYSALLYHFCRIPKDLFTPLFVISRITGWTAHFIEQKENNKLIRPLSRYTGPKPLEWVFLDKR